MNTKYSSDGLLEDLRNVSFRRREGIEAEVCPLINNYKECVDHLFIGCTTKKELVARLVTRWNNSLT
ncbi:hypothetical protein LXL04_027345 [Taraxacum kok-saghyz]